jgi:hypothetical protein
MHDKLYRNPQRRPSLCFWAPALLGLAMVLPSQSSGQATNACNLLPNPSFDQQNVAQLSGQSDNVRSAGARYDEVTGWQYTGFALGSNSTGGRPVYFASNAPASSATNPSTSSTAFAGRLLGIAFQPFNNDATPGAHNGAISIITAINCGSGCVQTTQDCVSPTSLVNLSGGKYYASFQAYHSTGAVTPLTLCLSPVNTSYPSSIQADTRIKNAPLVTAAAWTRVADIIDVPAPASGASSQDWQVTIGNPTPFTSGSSGTGAGRYHIDEVELYKIPTAGPPVSCNGGGSVLIGEGCHIPGATYSWRFNGQQLSATTRQITVSYSGTYSLTVNLPGGLVSTSSVTVTGCTTLPGTPTAGTDKTCTGEYIQLGDPQQPAIPGVYYQWSIKNVPNSIFDDAPTTWVYPNATKTYVLTVFLPNGTSGYTSYSSEVTVTACPPPYITVDNQSPCPGSPVTFTAHPGAYAWRTSPAGMFTPPSLDNSATFTTYANVGTGTVTAHTYYDEDYVAVTKTITAKACPTESDYSIVQLLGQNSCNTNRCHYNFSITGPAGSGPLDYHWSLYGTYYDMVYNPRTGGYIDRPSIAVGRNTTSPFVPLPTGNGPGTMTIYCVFRDPSGCCDDVAVPVDIQYDGIWGEVHRNSVAGSETAATGAYPNPASESLTLPAGITGAVLLNSQGRVVQRSEVGGKVNVRELPAGLYNLQMQQNGKLLNQHIEVKH